jgi:hypothetical protein
MLKVALFGLDKTPKLDAAHAELIRSHASPEHVAAINALPTDAKGIAAYPFSDIEGHHTLVFYSPTKGNLEVPVPKDLMLHMFPELKDENTVLYQEGHEGLNRATNYLSEKNKVKAKTASDFNYMFENIIKMAAADARCQYGIGQEEQNPNPVEQLTHAMQNMGDDAKPFWLYDSKKNDPSRSDTSWGPATPLNSGDAADRNTPFSAGLNIVFGGV